MKALKIIVVTILVLFLGFLSIGLISGKQEYEAEVLINKPVSDVFYWFNNHEKLSEWLHEVKSFEVINETENKIGSTYKMIIDSEGKEMELHETLTGFKENEMVEMLFEIGEMNKNNLFQFINDDGNTKLTARYTVEANNIFTKSMFFFFTGMFKQIDTENLNKFKAFVEAQPVYIEKDAVQPTIVN
jgi:uncharacterized membrane protein